MSDTKFPWNEPNKENQYDIDSFINHNKHFLEPNQLDLLIHLKNNIYGLKLDAFYQKGREMRPRNSRIAVFSFEHLGVKGSIEFVF